MPRSWMRRLDIWAKNYSVSLSWTLIFSLLVLSSALTYINYRVLADTNQAMTRYYETLSSVQRLLIAMDEAETGHRGYIITERESYLEPFLKAKKRLPELQKELIERTEVDPDSREDLMRLSELIALKLEEMETILDIRRKQGFEEARKRVMEDIGKQQMDSIREIVTRRRDRIREKIAAQEELIEASRTRAVVMLAASSIVLLGMSIAAFMLTRRQLKFRQNMETKLRTANVELEERVTHRTKALLATNEQLQEEVEVRKRSQAEAILHFDSLQRSNQELEQFASVASHDLQEPLRKIQAFSDRLTTRYRDKLDDNGQLYIDRIQTSAARMRQLIEDLLAFSRVNTKGKPFQLMDLRKLVEEVLGDLDVRIQETGAKIEIDELPTLEADPLQMRQLFQNLLGNSLKFHRKEVPPILQLQCELLDWKNKPGCRITLIDNGIGFEQQYTDRIFQLFQRLHGKMDYEGTGMGLAICKKIVERHHGSIEAYGSPNLGSRFVIFLPLSQTFSGD